MGLTRPMASFGEELIRSASEALEIAQGMSSSNFILVPDEVDVDAIHKRKHMSQEHLAQTSGLATSAVRDWEQKRRAPDRTSRVPLTVIDRNPEAVSASLEVFAEQVDLKR